MPTELMGGMNILMGVSEPGDYTKVLVVTVATMVACFIISIPLFNKRRI